MTLLRRERSHDDLGGLRARVQALDATLIDREGEVARAKAALDVFKAQYRHQVGTLHSQLDELEAAIAEAELGELVDAVGSRTAGGESSSTPREQDSARFTSDAIRRLFRDVAKAIHPDLASDDLARRRRHALMAEANRAYADGDEEQLRLILDSWERSPEAVQGSDPHAIRQRLIRRIAQIEERLAALQTELDDLKASPVWELKATVDDAAAKGRDLVGEMVRRLERDILAATNRLDAMRR